MPQPEWLRRARDMTTSNRPTHAAAAIATESHLLRAVLADNRTTPGKWASLALAYARTDCAWERTNLVPIARSVSRVLLDKKPVSEGAVMRHLSEESCQVLLNLLNEIGRPEPLPLSCIEQECEDLCRFYRAKEIAALIAKAQHRCKEDVLKADQVANHLIDQLRQKGI